MPIPNLRIQVSEESEDELSPTIPPTMVTQGYDTISMNQRSNLSQLSVDDFDFTEVLGTGACGQVRLAVNKHTGERYAVKRISIIDKAKADQVVREVSALYEADCPTLVSFYGAYRGEGYIALLLEFMDAGTLLSLLRQRKYVPEQVAAAMAFQLLWACAYLRHERRIHRDIKPSNVLLSKQGDCKLSDFGLSAELENSIGTAASFVGTCRYMSPERISGGNSTYSSGYSFPSDIWAVGVVIYEATVGVYPFDLPENPSYIDMAASIVDSPPITRPPPSCVYNPSVLFTLEFSDFIASCITNNPDMRLSAKELLTCSWFTRWGIEFPDDAADIVYEYLVSIGISTPPPE